MSTVPAQPAARAAEDMMDDTRHDWAIYSSDDGTEFELSKHDRYTPVRVDIDGHAMMRLHVIRGQTWEEAKTTRNVLLGWTPP